MVPSTTKRNPRAVRPPTQPSMQQANKPLPRPRPTPAVGPAPDRASIPRHAAGFRAHHSAKTHGAKSLPVCFHINRGVTNLHLDEPCRSVNHPGLRPIKTTRQRAPGTPPNLEGRSTPPLKQNLSRDCSRDEPTQWPALCADQKNQTAPPAALRGILRPRGPIRIQT
ncbi:hypothetical protein VUR80DRAFT_6960 [Thermomyces stellatus]